MREILSQAIRRLWLQGFKGTGRRIFGTLTIGAVGFFSVGVARLPLIGQAATFEVVFIPIFMGAVLAGLPGSLAAAVGAMLGVDRFLFPLLGAETLSAYLPTEIWISLAFALLVGAVLDETISLPWRRDVRSQQSGHGSPGVDRILGSLANTVEVRDHHTQGHCRRVAKNAVQMGRALGLEASRLETLYWGAVLHDLGKIAVPEFILQKHGRLSEEEFAEIRRHPGYGADLLASVSPEFKPIAAVVRAHHERWDGLGYPLGCRGEEIPLLARIIAIVDVFEALTSERPYRNPMPADQALRYVRKGAGTQFDPALVPLFEALFERGDIDVSGERAADGVQVELSGSTGAIEDALPSLAI